MLVGKKSINVHETHEQVGEKPELSYAALFRPLWISVSNILLLLFPKFVSVHLELFLVPKLVTAKY